MKMRVMRETAAAGDHTSSTVEMITPASSSSDAQIMNTAMAVTPVKKPTIK